MTSKGLHNEFFSNSIKLSAVIACETAVSRYLLSQHIWPYNLDIRISILFKCAMLYFGSRNLISL